MSKSNNRNKRKNETTNEDKEEPKIIQSVMSKYFKKEKDEIEQIVKEETKPVVALRDIIQWMDKIRRESKWKISKNTKRLNFYYFSRKRRVANNEKSSSNKRIDWEPPNWREQWENILTMRITNKHLEPKGCDTIGETISDEKIRRLHILISLMLSSQTKDVMTVAAMDRLLECGFDVQYGLDVNVDELAKIIYPVGFWRRKAQYIKDTCRILRDKYNDDIPNTIEDLCALPGVGPKMAYLTMDFAWKSNQGIGVDVHVHRISHRLAWLPYDTKTPEQTRLALESWIPRELWNQINHNLVRFGQTQCLPVGPRCSTCLNRFICPASTIKSPIKKETKKVKSI